MVIGLIAGVLVVFAVLFFDRVKLDDPVGALSVHLVNGVFGTLAVGLFASRNGVSGLFFGGGAAQLLVQLKGVIAVGAFTAAACALAGSRSRSRWGSASRRRRRPWAWTRANTAWRPIPGSPRCRR